MADLDGVGHGAGCVLFSTGGCQKDAGFRTDSHIALAAAHVNVLQVLDAAGAADPSPDSGQQLLPDVLQLPGPSVPKHLGGFLEPVDDLIQTAHLDIDHHASSIRSSSYSFFQGSRSSAWRMI